MKNVEYFEDKCPALFLHRKRVKHFTQNKLRGHIFLIIEIYREVESTIGGDDFHFISIFRRAMIEVFQ
jgi:hypothetical protein